MASNSSVGDALENTDGLFHKVFDEIQVADPEIETEHSIIGIGIGAARLATRLTWRAKVLPTVAGSCGLLLAAVMMFVHIR